MLINRRSAAHYKHYQMTVHPSKTKGELFAYMSLLVLICCPWYRHSNFTSKTCGPELPAAQAGTLYVNLLQVDFGRSSSRNLTGFQRVPDSIGNLSPVLITCSPALLLQNRTTYYDKGSGRLYHLGNDATSRPTGLQWQGPHPNPHLALKRGGDTAGDHMKTSPGVHYDFKVKLFSTGYNRITKVWYPTSVSRLDVYDNHDLVNNQYTNPCLNSFHRHDPPDTLMCDELIYNDYDDVMYAQKPAVLITFADMFAYLW